MASSVVVCDVSQSSIVLRFIGGFEIGEGSDGSGDWGLYSTFVCITAMVLNAFNRLGGRLRSLRLGGTIGCWFPNTYGIVGSLESDSIVIICGSGDVTDETVITSHLWAPDSSLELRTAGVFCRAGLRFSDERST